MIDPGREHVTDGSGPCWCRPDVFRPCPACAGAGAGCPGCSGRGLVPDPAAGAGGGAVVVHREESPDPVVPSPGG